MDRFEAESSLLLAGSNWTHFGTVEPRLNQTIVRYIIHRPYITDGTHATFAPKKAHDFPSRDHTSLAAQGDISMHNVHMKPRRGLRRLASFLAHHIPRPRNARAKSRTGGCSKFGTHSEELEDILSSVDIPSTMHTRRLQPSNIDPESHTYISSGHRCSAKHQHSLCGH